MTYFQDIRGKWIILVWPVYMMRQVYYQQFCYYVRVIFIICI